MAKPSTTHVIEIQTGIGEPAFIPLTLGQELQPISVGKKGMWRIESAKVLDVHAFVYFDGTSLFLQSADEQAAAMVDGFKVGKAWTELHAPCAIEIGAARLRYRSLLPDADGVATTAQAKPPVQAPPGGPGGPPKVKRPPTPMPPSGVAEPMTFPKAERPFAPGALASRADEGESTRVKPIDSGQAPRPAAGRPPEQDPMTRLEGQHGRTNAMPQPDGFTAGPMPAMGAPPPGMMQPPMMQPVMPMQPVQPMPGMVMQPMMTPGTAMMPMAPMAPPMAPVHSNPGTIPPGIHHPAAATVPPGMMIAGSGPYPQMGPGFGSGSVPHGMHGGFAGPGQEPQGFAEKYRELSPPKKILVVLAPFCLLAAAYLILFDDNVEPPPLALNDAGMMEAAAQATPPPTAPTAPTAPPAATSVATPTPNPCPPGYVPFTGVQLPPGTPIPCIPGTPSTAVTAPPPPPPPESSDSVATPTPPEKPPHDKGDKGDKDKDKDKHHASHQKTLERQAVDYVATGEYLKAAAIYDQLQKENPKNPVYVEAARILRLKADAGAP